MDRFLQKKYPSAVWNKESVKQFPSRRNYTIHFTRKTEKLFTRAKNYFQTHESSITFISIGISLLLVVLEAVIVTLLLRRINRLESRIFIRKRVLRTPDSPILRHNRVNHPPVACSFTTAPRVHSASAHPNIGESIALLHKSGMSVSANNVPLNASAPTPDNEYTSIPTQGAISFRNTTIGQHPQL